MISVLRHLALALTFSFAAAAETTTFEQPLVSGVPTSLPIWSGFSPVVLQYGVGLVQDTAAGAGTQSLKMSSGSAVAWSPDTEPAVGGLAATSFFVRHDVFSTALPVIPSEELSAVIFINNTGIMALDGNTSGGGDWQTLQSLATNTFYHVMVVRDYVAKTYDVEIDGTLVADDFGFKDPVTNSTYLASFECESSGHAWLDDVGASFESESTPPTPDPLTWATIPTPGTPAGGSEVILATDFTGRTVSGNTASNITWITNGVSNPGNLTAVDVDSSGSLNGLFTTSAAANRFIPDLNVGDEGPWSATVTLTLTTPSLSLQDIVLDFQHVGNSGTIPTVNKSAKFTASVTGSVSGLLHTVSIIHNVLANDGAGSDTFTFSPALTLDNSETYDVAILAEGQGLGVNVGLEALTLRRENVAIVDTDTTIHMLATTATDPSGVEYYFECISGGGHDSGWQDSPEYVDTGLSPGTRYTYRTRARDKSDSQNTTELSTAATATTTGSPPPNSFAEWIGSFGLSADEQDFEDDPDGDSLANGLEAWFGTHPGEFSRGLVSGTLSGDTFTFTHPQNATALSDLTSAYQWSKNLANFNESGTTDADQTKVEFSSATVAAVTTVTATITGTPIDQLFVRMYVFQTP